MRRVFLLGWSAITIMLASCLASRDEVSHSSKVGDVPVGEKIVYALPKDGLSEVARYRFSRVHYGIALEGTATLLIVQEDLDKETYQKTGKRDRAIPGLKMMLMKTLPSMNWEHRDSLAVYSGADYTPYRLSITSEEWCGNSYLELLARKGTLSRFGRPYTDDEGHRQDTVSVPEGYYFYEQLPILVRALANGGADKTLRIIAPETAYLLPHSETLSVALSKKEETQLTTPAGTFTVAVIEVKALSPSPYFPNVERYYVDTKSQVIVKAERNEVATEFGKLHVGFGTYELLDIRRLAYWERPVPPMTDSLEDRKRGTHNSYMSLNFSKVLAERQGASFDWKSFVTKTKELPAEYLSDPKGNRQVKDSFDGTGGWWFNPKGDTYGRPGAFELNYKP